jgi:EAL domain-containing protein (putative c-di-GMP-specific phosphodiesterase class I)
LSRTFGLEILRTAFSDRKGWPAESRDNVKLTIRLMASHLTHEDTARAVLDTLATAQIPPSMVCFEIVEFIITGLDQQSVATLNHLHDSGVDLSIAKLVRVTTPSELPEPYQPAS